MVEANSVHSTQPPNTSAPTWRAYIYEALLIASVVIASGAAGYLLGGLQ
jgi:hypothetical protein